MKSFTFSYDENFCCRCMRMTDEVCKKCNNFIDIPTNARLIAHYIDHYVNELNTRPPLTIDDLAFIKTMMEIIGDENELPGNNEQ